MKRAILGMIEFAFIVLIIFGFLCIVSEAEPFSIKSQIWLFVKGAIFIGLGVLGCAFIENKEGKV